jgi:hypothetical protein
MSELLKEIEAGQKRDRMRFDQIATFEVLRAWIEPELPVVRTKSIFKSRKYPKPITVGETYLIAVSDLEDGFYWISNICADAFVANDATKKIEALDNLRSSP